MGGTGPPLAGAGSFCTNLGSNTVMLAAGGVPRQRELFFLQASFFNVWERFWSFFCGKIEAEGEPNSVELAGRGPCGDAITIALASDWAPILSRIQTSHKAVPVLSASQ